MTAAARPASSQPDDDVARVADMLDVLAAGDVAVTVTGLECLLTRLQSAAAARELLMGIDSRTLKAALALRRQRAGIGARR